jgi:hypothetical protein
MRANHFNDLSALLRNFFHSSAGPKTPRTETFPIGAVDFSGSRLGLRLGALSPLAGTPRNLIDGIP